MGVGTGNGIERHAAGIKHQNLIGNIAFGRHTELLGGPRTPEGHIDEIITGSELESRRAALGTGEKRQFAIGSWDRAEHAPGQAMLHRLAAFGELGIQPDAAALGDIGNGADGRSRECLQFRHLGRAIQLLEGFEGFLCKCR